MIKDNMTLLLYYDETTTLIYNMINNSVLGKIDNDSSLIRYLLNIMELHNVRVNENGYLVLRKLDNVVTTLQRVIIEFYSRYDVKLKELLDKGYEVNHINKDKLDNRLCNLELVSHLDNIKHRDNKQYTVVYSSNELLKLQHIVKINQQYEKDTIYLQKITVQYISIFLDLVKVIKINLDLKNYICNQIKQRYLKSKQRMILNLRIIFWV